MRSLRARLIVLWLLSLTASVAVGVLLLQLSRNSTTAQVERATAVIAHACDLIRDRYDFYTLGWQGPVPDMADAGLRTDLTSVVAVALANQDGVEGGIWQATAGSLAYAFPTYEGTGPKTDLPAAEHGRIEAVNRQVARDERRAEIHVVARAQTLLLQACLLPGPISGLTAWTMTRVQAAAGLYPLRLGLGVLMGLMILLSAWISRTLLVWGRHIRSIEAALGSAVEIAAAPRTGERELDRIIDALNEAGRRVGDARRRSELMAAQVARNERLASLGRVAAGLAHEIRNPLAAARLQGENALAGDAQRRAGAITAMLVQIDRLDALTAELLAMTQRAEPRPAPLAMDAFVAEVASRHKPAADARGVTLETQATAGVCAIDPTMVGRILDNLLGNAIRHARPRGHVALLAERQDDTLTLTVEDDGEGVPPMISDSLFEPFVTGRPDGTGLGLAIARELADAHGGRLRLSVAKADARANGGPDSAQGHQRESGAVFVLELPCPRS